MTRAEIAEKFKFVKQDTTNPKEGDCHELSFMPIKEQLKSLSEGKQKIFFIKVEKADFSDEEMPEISLRLVSEDVYISPTKYV